VTLDLFDTARDAADKKEVLYDGAVLLHGFALAHEDEILDGVDTVLVQSAVRHMFTRSGLRLSVAMTNCGDYGWISDRNGYRYAPLDPVTGKPWPAMPAAFVDLARSAALAAGYADFEPDACLVNRYEPGTRLTLHQDKNERDFAQPIVSVSLGIDAVFLFGGLERSDRPQRLPLTHGDVVVWGGPSRMRYHGVMPLKVSSHPRLKQCRINLTMRRAM